MNHFLAYDEAERLAIPSPETTADISVQATTTGSRYNRACWIYLASSAIATVGWIWFLASSAFWLFRLL